MRPDTTSRPRWRLRPTTQPSPWLLVAFLALGGYLVVGPLSSRGGPNPATELKLLRVLFSLIVMLSALLAGAWTPVHRGHGRLFLTFLAYTVAGGLWSPTPVKGVLTTGMYGVIACAGLLVAFALKNLGHLRMLIAALALPGVLGALAAYYTYSLDPGQALTLGRLSTAQMNANTVGMAAAAFLPLAAAAALYSRRTLEQVVYSVGTLIVLWCLGASGSRSALLMAAPPALALVYLSLRNRPGRAVIISLGLLILGSFLWGQSGLVVDAGKDASGFERLISGYSAENRSDNWRYVIGQFTTSPVFGSGWLSFSGRAMNAENVYIQILGSGGLLGFVLFGMVIFTTLRNARRQLRALRAHGLPGQTEAVLVVAILAGLLLHGFGESALLLGTTPNAALFGLCVGLIDRIYALARNSVREA